MLWLPSRRKFLVYFVFSLCYMPLLPASRRVLSSLPTSPSVVNRKFSVEKIPVSGVKRIFKSCSAVCFDVDSTVIQEEGVDMLAEFKKCGDEVKALTTSAMSGSMLFQDSLKARLDLIRPSFENIQACNAAHPPKFSPGICELIDKLHEDGKLVFLVSGGFRQMIEPIADKVNIPLHRIFANKILFDSDGNYSHFDPQQPTSRDGGKPKVIQQLKDELGLTSIVMVGDGVTDMQARPPADAFIGYGGVVERDLVKEGADWFINDFQELIDALD